MDIFWNYTLWTKTPLLHTELEKSAVPLSQTSRFSFLSKNFSFSLAKLAKDQASHLPTKSLKEQTKICPGQAKFERYLSQRQAGIKDFLSPVYSWHFSCYSTPIHWLVHGHMTYTWNCLPPNAMSRQHCKNYDVRWETVHCNLWNIDRCCTWSDLAVSLESLQVFQLVWPICFEMQQITWWLAPRQNLTCWYCVAKTNS